MLDDKEFLERMRLTYLEESREKIQSLYALLENWASSPEDLDAFQSFERAVHNLVGSGASFGVPRITDAGKAYENFLNWFKEKRLKLNPQRLAVMREAISEIDNIFAGERNGAPLEVGSCRILTIFKNSTG